jgi:hypothetical protein
MRSSRTTIAVIAAIAALGALAAVAFAAGGDPTPSAPRPTAETDPPVQVKTQVIRRTVQVRRRAASSNDDGTLDQGPGDRPQIPVSPGTAPATGHDVGDDHGHHDEFDDHGGDDHDNSGPGSENSGHGGGDDDSGHGGHGDDDD